MTSSAGARAGAIIAGIAIAAVSGASAVAAASVDKAFTMANYPVEARAKDAVAAKERAHAEGQQAALRSLLKRIVPVTAYDRLKRFPTAKAADLVDGVAVRQERNSSIEYIANLDFTFRAEGVRALLRREGVPFIDVQAPEVLIVPVVRDPAGTVMPTSSTWTDAWQGLDLAHTLTPVKLAALKPAVGPDVLRQLNEGDVAGERALARAYGTDLVVAALAELDADGKRVNVVLTGADAVGPIRLKRSYRLPGGDLAYGVEMAAVVSLGVLEGRWKAVQMRARGGLGALAGPGDAVHLQVEFTGHGQWNDIRRELLETPGIDDVRVEAISARSADVSLKFPGGAEPLAERLAGQGLRMQNIGGSWSLRMGY